MASLRVADAGLLLRSAPLTPCLDDDSKKSTFQFDRTGLKVYFKDTNNMQYIALNPF